jgi:hypothetical protein
VESIGINTEGSVGVGMQQDTLDHSESLEQVAHKVERVAAAGCESQTNVFVVDAKNLHVGCRILPRLAVQKRGGKERWRLGLGLMHGVATSWLAANPDIIWGS